ncbi:MAG: PAS domain-containing protein [Rhodospirillaceae bacterium]|nr:PAS domain-containing protein [Rhodospirillaceae bacterium]
MKYAISIAGILLLIFLAIDLLIPLGVAAGIPYIAVVLTAWWMADRRAVFILASLSTLFVVIGYFFSQDASILWMVLANRAMAIFAIWTTATLLLIAKQSTQEQKNLVRERTRELRESEIRSQEAQRIANIGSWQQTIAGENYESGDLYWSNETYRIFGLQPGEQTPTAELFFDRIHPDDRERHKEAFAQATTGGGLFICDHRIVLPSGEVRYVQERGEVILDDAGRPMRSFGTVQDISEVKRAEDALRESEKSLRLITDNIPALISYVDNECRYRFLNKRYEEWFCRPIEEMLDQPVRKILSPESFTLAEPWITRALSGERVRFGTYNLFTDGKSRYLDIEYVPDIAEDGLVRGYFSVVNDISDRKLAAEALTESEARLAEAQQIANVGSWTVVVEDGEQTETIWSAQLCRIFEIKPDAVPRNFDAYLSHVYEQDRELLLETWTSSLESGVPYEIEYRIVRPSGEVRWVVSKGQSRSDQTPGISRWVGATSDITERKQAAEELQQALKMEALGQLTGGVAHDFNNLLTVIMGTLELLREEGIDDSARVELIDRGTKAVERGAALTHRLLAFSRKQTLLPNAIDLNVLIADLTDMLRRTLGERIEIRNNAAQGLWTCRADQSQLENAFLNLTINARDAMPDGGTLTIETANLNLDDEFSAVQADVEPGDYVMIGVSDSGIGIPPETLKHVFEPFFTTKEVGKGSGLGLSMVYGFAKQSGGNATIYSEPDEGTTVKVYLPRSNSEDNASDSSNAAGNIPTAKGERILVVEDNPDVRVLAVALLSDLGYEIVEAGDAQAGLDAMAHSDRIDLLLSDVVLPGTLNGPELAVEVRRRDPGIKIIFMTGYAEDAFSNRDDTDAQMNLIQKPFGKADLANIIRRVLDS